MSDSSSSSSSDGGSSSSDEEAPLVPALQALRDSKGKGKELPTTTTLPTSLSASEPAAPLVGYAAVAAAAKARLEEESDSDSSSSSSSSGSSSRSVKTSRPIQVNSTFLPARPVRPARQSTSPSPPPSAIPAFTPFANAGKRPAFLPPPAKEEGGAMEGVEGEAGAVAAADGGEAEKKKRFREFWMGKLVQGFGGDLDVVRQVSPLLYSCLVLFD